MKNLFNKRTLKRVLLPLSAILALLAISCGDTSTTGTVDLQHVINGVLAYDGATNRIYGYLEITRNGEPFSSAIVRLVAPDTLTSPVFLGLAGAGVYGGDFPKSVIRDTSTFQISSSNPTFNFNFVSVIPDTFTMRIASPANKILRGSQTVGLEWNGSRRAKGYFVIVKPTNYQSTAVGDSLLAPLSAAAASISNDAFRDTQGNLQPGTYNIWVVAYTDSPIAYPGLTFNIPDGLTDNLNNRVGIKGRIGAMFIAKKDVLTVETNP